MLFLLLLSASCTQKTEKDSDKSRPGWTLVWEDTFDGPIDWKVWSKITEKNHKFGKNVSSNDALFVPHEGNLVLRGVENTAANAVKPFLTGGLTCKGIPADSVVRVEVRAQVNSLQGAASYISLLPSNTEAVSCIIDVMECFGTDEFVYQSVNTDYTSVEGQADNPPSNVLVGVNPKQYHIYSVEKYPDNLVFFVDDIRTKKYPRLRPGIPGQFPFNDLDLNLFFGVRINKDAALGGVPVDLFIDWVRFYVRER